MLFDYGELCVITRFVIQSNFNNPLGYLTMIYMCFQEHNQTNYHRINLECNNVKLRMSTNTSDGQQQTPRDLHIDASREIELLEIINSKQLEILVPAYVLVVLMIVIGIPGNIITVCVYKRKMRRTTSRIFILALAFVDLSNCLFTMPIEISIIMMFLTFDFPVLCAFCRTLTYILNGISALLLCGIAVDRYRKICMPLKPVFTPKKTRSICIAATLIGISFYIPGFILYGTQTVVIPFRAGNSTYSLQGHTCQINDQYKETKIQSYILAVWFLATIVILVLLIIMYSRIGKAVYKRLKFERARHYSVSTTGNEHLRKRVLNDVTETSCSFEDVDEAKRTDKPEVLKTMSLPLRHKIGKSLKENFRLSAPNVYSLKRDKMSSRIHAGRTTTMLFLVTIAYILSFIPFIVIVLVRTVKPQLYEHLSDAEKSIWNFFLRSYVFNCAINPILYGFFNKDFRAKMVELLRELYC